MARAAKSYHPVHPIHRLLFLYLEPFALVIGAYITFFTPTMYLSTVHATPDGSSPLSTLSNPSADPTIRILLAQLTNVYVLFGLLEPTLLRATTDLRVWKAWLRAALIADIGHLLIFCTIGSDVGWRAWELGVADWAKPCVMILGRVSFLTGWGIRKEGTQTKTA